MRASGGNSSTLKRILKARAQAHPHLRWVVGRGNIYFWDDHWIGDTPLRDLSLDDRGDPLTLVSDFIVEGAWDVPKLQLLHEQAGLPQWVILMILDTPILLGEPDVPRWTLSPTGEFTMATTWEATRAHGPIIPGLEDIWKTGLTKSIAIFAWRLLSNRIPVDTKLQWRRMEMASKCQCCPHRPAVESLQHLFIQGAGARSVWREFDSWFEGTSSRIRINDTIPERLEAWANRLGRPGKKHLCRAIPFLILWFLWAERNRSRHQSVMFKAYNVVWQVHMFIRNSIAIGNFRPKHWKGVRIKIDVTGGPVPRNPRPPVMAIKWNPPDSPWIKLNSDGAYIETTGKAGGGGILRDQAGHILAAFASPFGAHSALEAELLAIHHGLVLAREFGRPIWIESDSEQAVHLLNGTRWGPANVCRVMARLAIHKRQQMMRATYIPREGNKAADLLAKMGVEGSEYQRLNGHTVPRLLKAIARLDSMGTPNIRLRDGDED